MQLEPMSRRSFLRIGATCTAVTTATVMSGCSWITGNKEPGFETDFGKLLVLDNAQANTLFAFAEAILPQGNGFPDAKTTNIVNRSDEEFFFIDDDISDQVKLMLDIMSYLPIFYGKFSRFAKMNNEDRIAFLESLGDTTNDTVRVIINNCRMLVFTMYYGHRATWDAIGYEGTFSRRPEVLSEQRQYYAKLVGEK